MIALVASVLLALYFVIPSLLFRFIYRLFIPLRVIEGSKTGEATRAVINTIVPFVLALVLVWYIPAFDSFPVEAAHPEFKIQDYKTIVGCFIAKIYLGKTRWHSGRQ